MSDFFRCGFKFWSTA